MKFEIEAINKIAKDLEDTAKWHKSNIAQAMESQLEIKSIVRDG